MSDFNISGPGPGRPTGAYVNTEHIDHLLVYGNPNEEERTSSRDKDKYLVAHCEWVVCLECKKAWNDTDVSGKVLAPRILSAESGIVVVRLNLGEARPNQNAPVVPLDPIPIEIEDVQKVLAKYAGRMPSGRVMFDVAQYNADNPAAPVESAP